MAAEKLFDGVWKIEDDGVRCFVIAGEERALLIDTGWGNLDMKAEVAAVTDLPVTLVCTHGDVDHVGKNADFKDDAWANINELPVLEKVSAGVEYKTFESSHVFDLGGRKIEAIHAPGHTPGHTVLLDRENGILFSGDTTSEAIIYMFGDKGRDFDKFIATQHMLKALGDTVKVICPCHGPCPIEPEGIYDQLAELAQNIKNGAKTDEIEHMVFPGEEFDVFLHRLGRASIYSF